MTTHKHGPSRRDVLRYLGAAFGVGAVNAAFPQIGWGDPVGREIFFVNVQANGGWDQALFCDPKPALRGAYLDRDLYLYGVPVLNDGVPGRGTAIVRNPTAGELRSTPGGGIEYLGFADFHAELGNPDHPYQAFFPNFHDRLLVLNGVDTGTNNHSVGARYLASGSLNEGYPCSSVQAAWARGPERPLSFLNMGGYDETAGLLAATPMSDSLLPNLLRAVNPNDISGNNDGTDLFVDAAILDRLHAERDQSVWNLASSLWLPDQQRALEAVRTALARQTDLRRLRFATNDLSQANLIRIGFEAFRQGLAVSMNVQTNGFDSHQDNEQQQVQALYSTLETVKLLINESESPTDGRAPVPVVALVSTDFGRTPFRSDGGTDHWPISSVIVVANRVAQAMGVALPLGTTIGGTTDGDVESALFARRVDPASLGFSDAGIVLTPGHVHRALRRVLGIEDAPNLADFPLDVEVDLELG